LADVEGQAGGLPLLQHALYALWERRTGRPLTHAAYEAIGGVEGALEQHAETVYARLDEDERALCRRVLLRLVQPGEGTEDTLRRVALSELLPAEGDPSAVQAVIQSLSSESARLLTAHGERVEVAHTALIPGWSRLQGWIEEDRESLRFQRRLSRAAGEWDANEPGIDYLWSGARLAEAEEWVQVHRASLTTLELAFVEVSVARALAARAQGLADSDPSRAILLGIESVYRTHEWCASQIALGTAQADGPRSPNPSISNLPVPKSLFPS
jgi:hypothetical protein